MSALAVAQSITDLPPVIVTAPRLDGGSISCGGMGCAGALFSARIATPYDPNVAFIPYDDYPVDGEKFCQLLGAAKPSGCSASNPPPSPGIAVPGMSSWQPNGCGTGGIGSWFQDAALEVFASQSYSGNIHAPYPGVSFKSACDGHDRCWARGGARGTCDEVFRVQMFNACGQQSTCRGFASSYHGAVSVTNGSHGAYATTAANRICAVWAYDMRENDCAK